MYFFFCWSISFCKSCREEGKKIDSSINRITRPFFSEKRLNHSVNTSWIIVGSYFNNNSSFFENSNIEQISTNNPFFFLCHQIHFFESIFALTGFWKNSSGILTVMLEVLKTISSKPSSSRGCCECENQSSMSGSLYVIGNNVFPLGLNNTVFSIKNNTLSIHRPSTFQPNQNPSNQYCFKTKPNQNQHYFSKRIHEINTLSINLTKPTLFQNNPSNQHSFK